MRSNRTPTDGSTQFERRLKQTMGSELEPEMITPNTAGAEELTAYVENFPLVEQFRQTNMKSGGRRVPDGQKGRGRDAD
jgi:hypothetical protein